MRAKTDRHEVRVMVHLMLLLAAVISTPSSAATIEHGKILVEQHCTTCHDSRVFTRPDHKIRSLEALKNQVESCEARQTLEWPQSDVDDVIAYLDATFYKFGSATKAQK